jgi:hypothetical protein
MRSAAASADACVGAEWSACERGGRGAFEAFGARGAFDGVALGARLEALARAQAPLRRALARIAGRIAALRSWERLGFARVGDYARERAGLSGRQLQELAHVDARLAALPAVEAAFLRGALSWSKARLLARVAGPDDEARWVAFARRVPVRALEREVRALDLGAVEAGALAGAETDEDGRPLYPMAGVVVRCAPRVQGKFHRARQVARRVAGERLPTWACMEAVAAEALSALGGGAPVEDGDGRDASGEAEASGADWRERCAGDPRGAADVCAERAAGGLAAAGGAAREAAEAGAEDVCPPETPPAVRALVEGLEGADAFDLDARLRRAVALEQRIEAEMAPLLRRVADARLYARGGHASVAAFARERLGMSERKARALVRIARAASRCPELAAAFGAGALSWIQAQTLLPLLLAPECSAFGAAWVARAQRVTVRRLEEEVDAAWLRLAADPEAFAGGAGAPDARNAREPRERQTCAQATDSDAPSPAPAERARFFFAENLQT